MKKFVSIVFVFLVFAIVMESCKKPKDPIIPEELVLRKNVKMVGTTGLNLNVAATNFATGVYVYTTNGITPNVKVGDVLVSGEGDGYIRIVTSVSVSGNTYTIGTTQGTLEDVFIKGRLQFDFDLNFITIGKYFGMQDTILNRTLFQDASLSVVVQRARLACAPVFRFDLWFDTTGISSCDITSTNRPYATSASVQVTASQASSLLNRTDTLRKYTKTYVSWNLVSGNPIPVVVRMDMYWLAEYSITTASAVTTTFTDTVQGLHTIGAKYEGSPWQTTYNFNPIQSFKANQPPGVDKVGVTMTFRPVMAFKIMGIPGFQTTVGTKADIASRLATGGSGDWDLTAQNWTETTHRMSGTIFGKNVPDLPEQKWETNRLGFSIPSSIELTSGNNQRAFENQLLPSPVKVRVLDSRGLPAPGVPVHFIPDPNCGNVAATDVTTDPGGFAQTTWRLGNRFSPVQQLKAYARRGDLSEINSSPIIFTAYLDTPVSCGPLADIDGNVYQTVRIGNNCWTARNSSAKRYSNAPNNNIPQVQDSATWVSRGQLQLPAYCNFFGDDTVGVREGRIYNWYSVTGTDRVCPVGWRVPTQAEWQSMIDSLGGVSVAGQKMKTDTVWKTPGVDGNNISGLAMYPVGSRNEIAVYSATDFSETYFWTATSANSSNAFAVRLRYNTAGVSIIQAPKSRGYSVRCIR